MNTFDSQQFELHIDELVLVGFGPVSRRRVASATRQGLSSLFAQKGIPDSVETGDVAALPVANVRLRTDASATEIGRAVANSIYQGLMS